MKLILGAVDIPYAFEPKEIRATKRRIGKARKAPKSANPNNTITTGDVAEILEAKYHVMENFFELHKADIAHDLEEAIGGRLENILAGAPISNSASAFAEAESAIETRFRNMLATKELDQLGYPGIPTRASLEGVSHRFKHPYAKRAPRPSFVDTGLFSSAFAAEIKDD